MTLRASEIVAARVGNCRSGDESDTTWNRRIGDPRQGRMVCVDNTKNGTTYFKTRVGVGREGHRRDHPGRTTLRHLELVERARGRPVRWWLTWRTRSARTAFSNGCRRRDRAPSTGARTAYAIERSRCGSSNPAPRPGVAPPHMGSAADRTRSWLGAGALARRLAGQSYVDAAWLPSRTLADALADGTLALDAARGHGADRRHARPGARAGRHPRLPRSCHVRLTVDGAVLTDFAVGDAAPDRDSDLAALAELYAACTGNAVAATVLGT